MIKFVILAVVVLLVLHYLRNASRRGDAAGDAKAAPRGPQGSPQEMIQCSACGVHLPRSDALPGPGGRLYCCAEHRERAE